VNDVNLVVLVVQKSPDQLIVILIHYKKKHV